MGIGSGPSAINSASLGVAAPGRIQSRYGEDGIQHLFSAGLTEIVYGHGARQEWLCKDRRRTCPLTDLFHTVVSTTTSNSTAAVDKQDFVFLSASSYIVSCSPVQKWSLVHIICILSSNKVSPEESLLDDDYRVACGRLESQAQRQLSPTELWRTPLAPSVAHSERAREQRKVTTLARAVIYIF